MDEVSLYELSTAELIRIANDYSYPLWVRSLAADIAIDRALAE